MADRWTDERDRDWRDQDWRRSERFGRGGDQDRDRQFGRQDRDDEDRTFDPRGGYDDDRGYNQDRFYGSEDRGYGESGFSGRYGGGSQSRGSSQQGDGQYGSSESGYGGRYQSGYQGGSQSGGYGGQNRQDRSRFASQLEGPDRDRVFGERETGTSYRTGGASQSSQGGNYGGTPDYGREPGRAARLFGQEQGRESFPHGGYSAQGSQGGQGYQSFDQQREYGRGGEHFGQPYGQQDRNRSGQDYSTGGRFYGDDGRQGIYREQYGQGGREYGPVPGGYESPRWRGGAESYGGRNTGSAAHGWGGEQNPGVRWQNRDEREHHTPNVREGRGEGGRSWWDKAKNQVASFFGDDDAERRNEWDRQSGGYQSEGHRGRGPKGYKRSDERITEEVNQRLTDDPWVDASNIDVSVKDCEVTLSGTVADREDKRRAERVVEDIWGVSHVQNNLRVQQNQTQGQYGQGQSNQGVREGAGSILGQGSSDTSSRNPITGTGHGFGDTMLAAGDPAAAGAASLTDAGRTGTGGQGQTASAASGQTGTTGDTTGASSTASNNTGKDRNK